MRRPTVGDKVKIISPPLPFFGETGKIIRDDHDGCPFKVKFSNDDTWWYAESDVQLVEESSTPTHKLKVGDKVRVKSREWYEANKNSYGTVPVRFGFVEVMAKYCGGVYEIESINDNDFRLKGCNDWLFSIEMFDLDEPQDKSIIEVIKDVRDAVSELLSKDKPTFKGNIPLIKTNKLLTQIKLD